MLLFCYNVYKMNEEKFLKEKLEIKNESELKSFYDLVDALGLDKCVEIYHNLSRVTNEEYFSFFTYFNFHLYDTELSEILFTLLRHQENFVKAFLANVFNDYLVKIEARPSNYSKTKYYFKIPVDKNKFLDIRTFSYEYGPIDYYDAIKTLDFGDVNLIMSHLPPHLIDKFSTNPDIISDLDKTRKLRNYVYHHNLLFSLGKYELKQSIILVLRNLPNKSLKTHYINEINNLKLSGKNRSADLGDVICITIDDFDKEEVYKY